MKDFLKSSLKHSLLALVGLVLLSTPTKVYAALPDLIIDETYYNIDLDRGDAFFLYLPYGNPTLDKEIKNVTASIDINSESVKFVIDKTYDLYYSQSEGETVKIPACNGTYSGPKNLLDPEKTLKNDQSIVYGLQSAYKGGEVSGSTFSSLDPKATGCLEVGLQLTDKAQEGEVVEIHYNPDSTDSSDYPLDLKPAQQTIKIYIGEKLNCSSTQEVVNGRCSNKCEDGEVRNDEGACVNRVKTCEEGYDLFNGECLSACQGNEVRNNFGSCAKIIESKNDLIGKIANALIIITTLLFILTIALKVRSFIKRKGF